LELLTKGVLEKEIARYRRFFFLLFLLKCIKKQAKSVTSVF